MNFNRFCELTGATPRQINYWQGSIRMLKNDVSGSGNKKDYDEYAIPVVRTLVEISDKFGGYFSVDTLARIAEAYRFGELDFGDGIKLIWRVDEYIDGASNSGP